MEPKVKYEDQAKDFGKWGEYVDPGATMTEDEFNKLSTAEKVEIIRDTFGPERDE